MAIDTNRKGFPMSDFAGFSKSMELLNAKGNQQAAQPNTSPFTANLGDTNGSNYLQQQAIKGRDRAFGMAQDSQNFAKQQVWMDQGAKIRAETDQRRLTDRQISLQNKDIRDQKNKDFANRQQQNHQFAVNTSLQRAAGNRTERMQDKQLSSSERVATMGNQTVLEQTRLQSDLARWQTEKEYGFKKLSLDADTAYKDKTIGVENRKVDATNYQTDAQKELAVAKVIGDQRVAKLGVFNSLLG